MTSPSTTNPVEQHTLHALDRVLAELQHVRAAHDLLQEENRLLRAELGRLMKRHYPCNICGACWATVREADACHMYHQERSHA